MAPSGDNIRALEVACCGQQLESFFDDARSILAIASTCAVLASSTAVGRRDIVRDWIALQDYLTDVQRCEEEALEQFVKEYEEALEQFVKENFGESDHSD